MPSNKDILEAQRFNRRRLVTAFTSGTPGGKELESKSTTRPLIVGASLAALAVLIAVAVGRFVPTLPSGWQDSHLIITKGEGARYYSIEGTLRPVSNVTSAKLLSESGKLVTSSVSTSSLEGIPRGSAIGLSDVPDDIPTADQLRAYAAKVDPYPAEVAPASEEKDHYYTLVARDDIVQNLSEDVSRTVWTFNGNTPAPTLRGKIGDTFHITLKNEGTMGHSLDFHAGDIAPDEAMKTIDPGQTLEYTFTAKAAGIWMYHCSTHPMSMHITNGMTGAVIIDPSDLRPVDHEYAMVATELYLGDNGGTANATKIASMMPDLQAFNGRPFQYDAHPLKVKVGQRVRFWLMDSGPNTAMSFHIVGGQFDTVWDEGGYTLIDGGNAISRGGGGSQTFPMLPAQGGFVELSFKEPGTYTFVNHIMSLAEAGAHGKIEVTN